MSVCVCACVCMCVCLRGCMCNIYIYIYICVYGAKHSLIGLNIEHCGSAKKVFWRCSTLTLVMMFL